MKWLNFRISTLLLLMCPSFVSLKADDSLYQERVVKYHSFWNNLVPRHYKLQFAGSMGLLSFGPGWEYGKHHQWETDIYIGFLPKYSTSENKLTLTLKQNYIPWTNKPLGKHLAIDPLTVSLYVNSILGDEFWTKEPSKYPGGYYGFSTRVRFNLSMGQRFVYFIPNERRKYSKSVTFFYELATSDLYVASAFNNRYLKLKDIIHLSLGLKVQVF